MTRRSSFANWVNWIAILLGFWLTGSACVQFAPSPAPPAPPATVVKARPRFVFRSISLPPPTPPPACPLPDLPHDQHIAASGSYTETERAVSTPMLCHLAPDSCGYNQLVGLLESSIVFKQEEAAPSDVEDHLIHPAMLQSLAWLNRLVQAEWGGIVRLRVTDAYDSLLEHDPPDSEPAGRYSLHYEGRAVDLTTWPVDPNRYGRLCALAHCAGFDWVKNEGSHCHASIRAESLCLSCGP